MISTQVTARGVFSSAVLPYKVNQDIGDLTQPGSGFCVYSCYGNTEGGLCWLKVMVLVILQAITRQFAEILHFTLFFDDLKVGFSVTETWGSMFTIQPR